MTEIERKAQELVNEVRAERGRQTVTDLHRGNFDTLEALIRAIEQHEAFRQEVSDAVVAFMMDKPGLNGAGITRFIIAKPDPLVEAVKDILDDDSLHNAEEFSEAIRAALAKRGLEIREKSDG